MGGLIFTLESIMLRTPSFFVLALVGMAALSADAETITVRTLASQMRYDIGEINVSPGAEVKIVFENKDDLPHNLVFFKPGTDPVAVSNKQMENADLALKRKWLPEDDRIWLASKLLEPKAAEELVFKAPDKPGIYPYACTFPGHAMSMQGKLNVSLPGPVLKDLSFHVYLGDWKELPDFSTLKPHREGSLPDGLVEIKLDDYKNQFGVVYSGKLPAPKDGEYRFALASDDGGRLLIDGKKLIDNDGIHPSTTIKEAKVNLTAGDHNFRLEYFQGAGNAELYAAWSGPGFMVTPLSKWQHPQALAPDGVKKEDETTGMPLAVGSEPVIYRNFVERGGNRGVAVGYPGKVSIVWNAERMNLAVLWRGAFMDAARHWINRGGGAQKPSGFDAIAPSGETALPFAVLDSEETSWPQLPLGQRADGYQWKGYNLNEKRIPTFLYTWNAVKISDQFVSVGDLQMSRGKLLRTVKLDGAIPEHAHLLVLSGDGITAVADGFVLQNRLKVVVEGGKLRGKELVVPARREILVTYSWTMSVAPEATPK